MTEIEKPSCWLVKLRVSLGVLSFLAIGAPILFVLLGPILLPGLVAWLKAYNSSEEIQYISSGDIAVSWFAICSVSASLFAFSLLAKRISRQAIQVALLWTGVMVLTGIVELSVFMLFTGFLKPFSVEITRLMVVAFVIAVGVSWWVLLRSRRYKAVTDDPDPSLTFFLILLGCGYVAWVAGMAFMVFALAGL